MTEPELGDLEARYRRQLANDKNTHEAEVGLRLIDALRRSRESHEKTKLQVIRLSSRLTGMNLL